MSTYADKHKVRREPVQFRSSPLPGYLEDWPDSVILPPRCPVDWRDSSPFAPQATWGLAGLSAFGPQVPCGLAGLSLISP